MANPNSGIQYIPIDAEMRLRFAAGAAGALSRRTPTRLRGQLISMLQWFVIGVIGLLGLFVWDWPSVSLLIVWLAGIVVGIAGDLLRWLFARRRLIRQLEVFSEDQFVWHMVMAMQKNEERVQHSATQVYRPGFGLALDLGFGAFAIFLFAMWFDHQHIDVLAIIRADAALQKALVAVAVAPLLSLVATLATLGSSRDAEIDYQAGGRGLALFFIIIAFMFFSEMPDAIGKLMVFVNGATLLVGLLALFGLWLMNRERVWLGEYLRSRQSR